MDFTEVYNDSHNAYYATPPIVHAAGEKHFPGIGLSSGCVLSESVDAFGNPKPLFEVGLDHTFDPLNEPPLLAGNFGYLLSMMDAFKRGNYSKAGTYVQRLFDTEPKSTRSNYSTNRNLVSRSETNAEKCFFHLFDLERIAAERGFKSLCFLNPNKGSIVRFAEINRSVDVVLTDHDLDYVRSIKMIMVEKNWGEPKLLKEEQLDDELLYYSSFNGGCEFLEKVKYIAFTPDLVSMKIAGVPIVRSEGSGEYFEFMKGAEKLSVLTDCADYQYAADVVLTQFKTCDKFKASQGILHSLASSVDLKIKSPVVCAPPYPLALEFTTDVSDHRLSTKVLGPWAPVVSSAPIHARYVRSKHYGCVYDLGNYLAVSEGDKGKHDFVYDGEYYIIDRCGPYVIRIKPGGGIKYNGERWSFCDGIPIIRDVNELMKLRLSGLSIYYHKVRYVDSQVKLPLTEVGRVADMTSDEMRQFINGYNMSKLRN